MIGSAGSAAKVAYLRDELGLDAAFDHRAAPVAASLRAAAPDGIDVYFDSVGGAHLEAALGALRRGGRVALCGAVSEYERAIAAPGPRNLFQAIAQGLTLRGFRGSAHMDRMAEMQREVAGLVRDGRLRHRESIVEGLEQAPQALARVLAGATIGKTLVRIA